jgi:hypothetical protein
MTMFTESSVGPAPLTIKVKIMLTVWFVILVPWFPFFTLMGTGMAFEGGSTLNAYLFVLQVWAYPILVALTYYLRRRRPALVWLPALPLIPALFQIAVS